MSDDLERLDECIAHWELREAGDEAENDKRDSESCALCSEYLGRTDCPECPWQRIRGSRCDDLGETYAEWNRARPNAPEWPHRRMAWATLSPKEQATCRKLAGKVVETLKEIKEAVQEEITDD